MGYQDGDGKMTVMPPGSDVPAEQRGFDWVDVSWSGRRRGRVLARTIDGLAGGLQVTEKYTKAAAAVVRARADLEHAQHDLAHARDQVALLPLKIEAERQKLQGAMLQGQAQLGRALQEIQQAGEVSAAEHAIAMQQLEERRLRAKGKRKEAKRALKKRHVEEPAPETKTGTDGPDVFARHFRTMQEAKRNLSEGEKRIQAIYARAAAERRQLSDEELMEVDAISDAAEAAADEVRRGGASDF